MNGSEMLLSACLGLGVASACGFRVFTPLLVIGLAARGDYLSLASGFDWVASDVSVGVLAVATVLEIGAYLVPWLDNALDAAATPAAVVAGMVASSSMVGDMGPVMQWGVGIIGGGAAAGGVQTMTVLARGASTATTGGLANPPASIAESGTAVGLSILTVAVPVLAVILVLALAFLLVRALWRRRPRRHVPAPPA